MALGDAKVNLVDGGIGRTPKGADGIHLKVGIAEGGEVNKIYEANSYYDAERILKKGPLLDAIRVYFNEFSSEKRQEPVKIYFALAERDQPGKLSTVEHTGTGKATRALSGMSAGAREFIVEIVKGGASGTATYRKSSDGGNTFSEEFTTPASGSMIDMGAGVNIAFTDHTTPAESFIAGDRYVFSSTAPGASTGSILDAVNASKQTHEAKFVHVVGPKDKAFWASISQIADDWERDYHDHKVFILETSSRENSETVKAWAEARINESIGFYHKRVIVCPGSDQKYHSEQIYL